jgi:hypothetical protein
MIIQMPEEIIYLKDSNQILQKIEDIKKVLQEINCTSGISSIRFNDNILRLNLEISFPVT